MFMKTHPITGFEICDKKIRIVHTANEDFEPEQVVLAAGAWSPNVMRGLKLNIPVQPARGYSITMSAMKTMPREALDTR